MEPVLVTGIFPVFKDVLECEKSPPCMVEHPVQYDPDASLVECAADLLKVLVCAQADVYLPVIPCVVPMGIRLKQRGKVNGIYPQFFQMGNPFFYLSDPVCRHPVVFKGRAAESQRVDLIKNAFISPHKVKLLSIIGICAAFSCYPVTIVKQDSLIIKINGLAGKEKYDKISGEF